LIFLQLRPNYWFPILGIPQDFVEVILQNFKPLRNRVLKAELLEGSLDMKKYLSQYRVEIAGLLHTGHDDADANHCWRFIRRSDT
jgi:hypothetical protein